MPIEQVTLVTVATCDRCADHAIHSSSPEHPVATEFFTDAGWAIVEGPVEIPNRFRSPIGAAICPRCAPLLGRALIARSD